MGVRALLACVAVVLSAGYANAQLTMGAGLNRDCIDMRIREDVCWECSTGRRRTGATSG